MTEVSKRRLLAACSTIAVGSAGCVDFDSRSDSQIDTVSATGDGLEKCSSVTGDWLTFQGDHRNTGHSSTVGPIRSDPTRTTIAADVYTRHTDFVPLVTATGIVTVTRNGLALVDPASGERLWEYTPNGPIRHTPTIGCGAVYVQSLHKKHCIDLASGELYWRQNTGSAGRTGSFVMDSERLFTWPGIRVYDLTTGTRRQRRFVNSGVQGLALDENALYAMIAANDQGRLEAFDPATGKRQWRNDTVGESYRPPVVAHGHAYSASTNGIVTAVDITSGETAWQHDLALDELSSMVGVYEDETVYVPTGTVKKVVALNAETGKPRWQTPVAGGAFYAPIVGDELLYVPTGGTLAAIDRRTGVKQWEIDTVMNAELAASSEGLYAVNGSDLVRFS
ncbi:PQQ-binding-like beta-propeller repeat protein [Natrinema salsiterrestre]|uniref:PQQ-like beta-propeller repeat protein n=1 Tax=Natrinema salsiterrestre TaxID=2950540 RepID=A0A9Q4L896_9EURY|nr:PQQ-binding-like beta-propeller repeat protein [Natrinema salsiterrestre]MDF9747785.1 PQQ-like beta-propeller repeat protein [Natrinema salsiterrestre]